MQELTFGVSKETVLVFLKNAQDKMKYYESFEPNVENEIAYLESEISVVSSFIKYHELQGDRKNILCGLFVNVGEYGFALNTDESVVSAARVRLSELEGRLGSHKKFKQDLNDKKSFLIKDIELLNNILKSSPRPKVIEFGLLPNI
ncbi:hypothetical protein [Aeromonas veronii]|uniref:hypothetical protein n=1 Tax=Aeromonas veronii TaxID=654 RepID=UPI0024445AB1|nr:hypothetical protein [Aeromonas veronii]